MIIWLASYPKSGNTWIRSLLSAYLFSNDGDFNFELLNNFSQFPSKLYLESFLNSTKDQKEVYKHWIPAQTKINSNKKRNFLKTHNALCTIDQSAFTNQQNTSGAIYIVRDPRNVITSLSNHFDLSIKEAFDFFTNERKTIFESDIGNVQYIGSWADNYKSWKNSNVFPTIIIKYEDLLNNTKETFVKILNFLGEKNEIQNNNKKIDKAISSCEFDILKMKEEKEGFRESVISKKTKKNINFFHLGKKNDWKSLLDPDIEKKIREKFSNEMKELGYI
tara:strand:+ start:936 stop:1766 length:831 start_codon:yes stop_codon:yes gene_type:complete